ncbi:DUF2850 domain-containing protein [Vibrio tapetis subsp. quintayensis]|uniref:DUF2850 domain-containing protein n=1 Tax=Vibrio tapetis TaxID=52443 RepID=UPI0025B52C4C|nr:DUF2850 domain-containing protein [Vibrio tapetis]MDN3681399.1 DUF2850 domain-containing protein [Vibrio tapetis subsp. quintayensis]
MKPSIIMANYKKTESNNRGKKPLHHYARVWVLLSVIVIGLGYGGVKSFVDHQKVTKLYRQQIFGTWVEQNVADYAADSFVVKKNGIFIDGRQVTTQFTFDGVRLEFDLGAEHHRFEVRNSAMTQLKRVSPAHYESVFLNTTPPPPLPGTNELFR